MDQRISHFSQLCSLRRYTLCEGNERGLDVIDCDNGRLRFLLNVSCALDVMQLYHCGQNVSFVSKNGFSAPRGLPFAQRFEGGMLYTCGLDSVGDRPGFPVHGSLHETPARVVRACCDEQGITVEAEVRSCALFGSNLLLKRRFFTPVLGDTLFLEDTLINLGHTTADYCVLYHVNVGYPLLDAGAEVEMEVASCQPRTPWAAENMADMQRVISPTPGRQETCYFLKTQQPHVSVVNRKLGKRMTLSYTQQTLPYLIEWQSMACGDYALGLEPASTLLDADFAYRQLDAGQQVQFGLQWQIRAL